MVRIEPLNALPCPFPASGRCTALICGLVLLFIADARPLRANSDPATDPGADLSVICDTAATEAARLTGVPISVLKAISLTETGRKRDGALRPWPWTVNMEGKGVWFDTEDEARAYVYDNYKRGARSFDVGCFQINYRWHGEAFASIDEMFEPSANALYAARFLLELFGESGSWETAAGAYHSRTAVHADRYKKRFTELRSRFAGEDGLPLPEVAAVAVQDEPAVIVRVNTYPLLQTGAAGTMGSLFPTSAPATGGLVMASARHLLVPQGTTQSGPEMMETTP